MQAETLLEPESHRFIVRLSSAKNARKYITAVSMHLAALYSTLDGLMRETDAAVYPVQNYYVELTTVGQCEGVNPVTVTTLVLSNLAKIRGTDMF